MSFAELPELPREQRWRAQRHPVPSNYLMIQQFASSSACLPFAEADMVTDEAYNGARITRFSQHK